MVLHLVEAVADREAGAADPGRWRATLDVEVTVGVVLLEGGVAVVRVVVGGRGERAAAVRVQAVADFGRAWVHVRADRCGGHRGACVEVRRRLVEAVTDRVADLGDVGGARRALDVEVAVGVVLLEGGVAVVGVVDHACERGAAVGVQAVADLGGAWVDQGGDRQPHRHKGREVHGHLVEAVAVVVADIRDPRDIAAALEVAVAVRVVLFEGRVAVVGDELAAAAAVGVEAVAGLRRAGVHVDGDIGGQHRYAGHRIDGVLVEAVASAEAGDQRRGGRRALDEVVQVVVVFLERRVGVFGVVVPLRRRVAGGIGAAVGVEAVADLGRGRVDHRGESQRDRVVGLEVVLLLVEAVALRVADLVGPGGGAEALDVQVAVGVVLLDGR